MDADRHWRIAYRYPHRARVLALGAIGRRMPAARSSAMNTEVAFKVISRGISDARALKLLEDPLLSKHVRGAGKLSVKRLRQAIDDTVIMAGNLDRSASIDSAEVQQRLLKGLPGEAMFIASALAFDSFQESAEFFGLSTKAARQRIGRLLDAGEGEKVLHLVLAVIGATCVLGSINEARRYLKTPNFALGGVAPRDLLLTAEGTHCALNELQTHEDGGPA